MFEMMDRRTGRERTVYGVHKSGPLDEQTKFLIYANGWKWVWATYFHPQQAAEPVRVDVAMDTVDLLADVGQKATKPAALAG